MGYARASRFGYTQVWVWVYVCVSKRNVLLNKVLLISRSVISAFKGETYYEVPQNAKIIPL